MGAGQRERGTVQRHAGRLARRAGVPLLLAALLLVSAGCERWRKGESAPAAAPGAGPRLYPELAQVAAVVAEARAILPRLPSDAKPLPLVPPATGASAPPPEPQLALAGEGLLLQPSAFPDLPPRLRLELYLDERSPPGGYLLVTDARGSARWTILDAVQRGNHADAFADTFRLIDPGARLRYLALLGVPYEGGGQHFRSLEGYLIHPLAGGAVSAEGAIYPLDFGYRQAEPPPPVQTAQALAERLAALRTASGQWEALRAHAAELREAARRLREAAVPPQQAERQRADLADYERRSAAAQAEQEQAAAQLRERLLAAYRDRAALAEAWIAFTHDNAYLWRTRAERRAVYAPLAALRTANPSLEQAYAALHGEADADLGAARQALEQALLREQEHAPPLGG